MMAPVRQLLRPWLARLVGDSDSLAMATSSMAGFAIRAAGVLLMTVVTVLFTRLMGAEEYGRLAFLLSGSFIIVLFAGLGLPTASNRLVPRYLARGRVEAAGHYLVLGLAVVALMAAAGGAAFAVAMSLLPGIFGEYRFPVLAIIGLVVTVALMRFVSESSRGFGLSLAGFLAESITVRCLLLPALLTYLAAGLPLAAGPALNLYVAAQALAVVIVLILVARQVRLGRRSLRRRPWRLYRAWLGVSFVMLVTPVYYFLLFETDIVLLGILAGPYEVGLYQVARRLAELTVFCAGAASSVGLPRLARAHAERRQDRVQSTIDVMNLISVGSTGVVVLALVAVGPFALQIFGPEFAQGYPALIVLALGRLAAVLLGPASDLLLMTGHHRRLGRVNLTFAILNLALNFALIHWLGGLGAAIATCTASVSWSAWLYLMARRLTAIETCPLRRLQRRQQALAG
jgi:O-antigen/teichoic acid export membrane protein